MDVRDVDANTNSSHAQLGVRPPALTSSGLRLASSEDLLGGAHSMPLRLFAQREPGEFAVCEVQSSGKYQVHTLRPRSAESV